MFRGSDGDIITKFSGDQNKTLPVGLFFPQKFPACGHNSMPE